MGYQTYYRLTSVNKSDILTYRQVNLNQQASMRGKMTTSTPPVTEQLDAMWVRRSISLFPEQDAMIEELAREMAEAPGRENYSAALRRIINEWGRQRADNSQG